MAQKWTYSSAAVPGSAGWSVSVGSNIRLGNVQGLVVEAEMGSVGIGNQTFDDEWATIGHSSDGLVGLKTMVADEDQASTGNQRIYTGYVGDRRYYRDGSDYLVLGPARQVDVSLTDTNSFLNFRVFTGADTTANRPAETDVARLTWMLGHEWFQDTLFDVGFVNKGGPVPMDAVDYRGQRPQQLVNDCAQASGKNFWVGYVESGSNPVGATLYTVAAKSHYFLWYDFATSGNYSSPLQLTNVRSEADGSTIFLVEYGSSAKVDPSRVAAGVYLPYTGGSVYVRSGAVASNFAFRDAIAPSVNVKTAAKATALANRYLADNATEDVLISCTVQLPPGKVTSIRAGQLIKAHLTHLPLVGAAPRNCRIHRAVYRQNQDRTDAQYWIDLEMSPSPGCNPSGTVTSIYDSGTLGLSYAPAGVTIPTPSAGSVMFGMFGATQGGTSINGPLTLSAPWTLLDSFAPAFYNHDLSAVGYLVTPAGTAGNFTANGMTGGNFIWRTLGFKIATNATAPLQHATNFSTTNITLPSALTAGSILVLAVAYDDIAAGTGLVDTSATTGAGFTQIASVTTRDVSADAYLQMVLFTKCVAPGDTNVVTGASNPHNFWQHISEWAVT